MSAIRSNHQTINLTFNQIIFTFFVAMVLAGTFVVVITSNLVNARVGALEAALAAQNNPVVAHAPVQTNNAPGAPVACADPEAGVVAGAKHKAGKAGGGYVLGAAAGGFGYKSASASHLPLQLTYKQSNTSTVTNKSTYTDNRYSGNTVKSTDNRYSGNTSTVTNNQSWAWDNGNDKSVTTTNNKTVTKTNVEVKNNGNTTNSNNTKQVDNSVRNNQSYSYTNSSTNTLNYRSNNQSNGNNNGNTQNNNSGNDNSTNNKVVIKDVEIEIEN